MEAALTFDLQTHGVAKGGDAVAREPDGRVVFVKGALPDERVRVEVTESKKTFLRARAVEVIEASPHRIEPSCAEVARGCGGCDYQFVDPDQQLVLKATVVTEALERIGRLESIPDVATVPLDPTGYRTTVRCTIAGGRAGYRAWHSHEPVAVSSCEVAHPSISELIEVERFDGATEVMIRVGAATGDALVLVSPSAKGIRIDTPEVILIGKDELKAGSRAWITERVAGRTWRISAGSFFQARPDGAQALIDAVGSAIGDLPSEARAFDLYGGVGLFAGTVFAEDTHVVLIEQNASSVADAKANLADRNVRVVRSKVERWTPKRADAVVADPARQGLGADAVARISKTGAAVVALVSCDAAALGRDAGLLVAAGYKLDSVTLIDMFPMTSHTETVTRFVR